MKLTLSEMSDAQITQPILVNWNRGIPPVAVGKMERFWCLYSSDNKCDKYMMACYGNKYVMPLSDSCDDAPENAVPVGGDGDFEWTGWFEESCDHCDTFWKLHVNILAWMRLPKGPSSAPQGSP